MNTRPTSHLRLRIVVCWLLLVGLLNAAQQPGAGTIRLITKETSLGKLPLITDLKNLVVSPDNQQVAYPMMRGGQWTVWHDGVEGGKFKGIQNLSFSPDGSRLVYIGARGGLYQEESRRDTIEERTTVTMKLRGAKHVVVVDGKAGPEYESVGYESIRFSQDSQRVGYVVTNGGKWRIVVDGQEGPPFDGIEISESLVQPR